MENKQRIIFDIIGTLSKFKNLDFKIQNETVLLSGSSSSLFNKERINIEISKNDHKVNDYVIIKIVTNNMSFSEVMKKTQLYLLFLELNILNREQFPQFILEINSENRKILNYPDLAFYIFNCELFNTWPELKNDVNIQLLGERKEELVFLVKKGLSDLTFRAYFENGIKLKAAIRNCKNFKIEKLIFIDEMTNEYMDFTIDELEQMDLT